MGAKAVFHDIRDKVEVEISPVNDCAEDASDEDAGEENAESAGVEAIEADVHDGEDFEERVVDAVDERGVQVDEGDGWIFEGDFEGFDQCIGEDRCGLEVLRVDLALGH